MKICRRNFIHLSTGAALAFASHSCTQLQNRQTLESPQEKSELSLASKSQKIVVGYIPITPFLPLFMLKEKGLAAAEGLDLELVKFEGAQMVVEALLTGRLDACPAVASANLAAGEIASPGFCKVFGADISNEKYVLDVFMVAKDSPVQKIAELKDGMQIGCGPGIQQEAIARGVLKANRITDVNIVQLPWSQHAAALASGQFAASYTLEPAATAGKLAGLTRTLETGVFSKYILKNPLAPRFGGSAAVRTQFLKQNPEAVKRFINAYHQAVEIVRKTPNETRQYFEGYTPIKGKLAESIPLPAYRLCDEFTDSDLRYFQEFLNFFYQEKIFTRTVEISPLILKCSDL